MERLFVLAVGLDAVQTAEGCCGIYRAITRAHMFVGVVQEHVPGGWLEFTANLQRNDAEYDEAHERDLVAARENLTVIAGGGSRGEGCASVAEETHRFDDTGVGNGRAKTTRTTNKSTGIGRIAKWWTRKVQYNANTKIWNRTTVAAPAAEAALVIRQNVWNGNLNATGLKTTVSRLAFNPTSPEPIAEHAAAAINTIERSVVLTAPIITETVVDCEVNRFISNGGEFRQPNNQLTTPPPAYSTEHPTVSAQRKFCEQTSRQSGRRCPKRVEGWANFCQQHLCTIPNCGKAKAADDDYCNACYASLPKASDVHQTFRSSTQEPVLVGDRPVSRKISYTKDIFDRRSSIV
jgi:hypothetical protein